MEAIQPFLCANERGVPWLLGERVDFWPEGQHLRGLAAKEFQPVRLMRFEESPDKPVFRGCAGAGKVDEFHLLTLLMV